jgi:hypothetical protein
MLTAECYLNPKKSCLRTFYETPDTVASLSRDEDVSKYYKPGAGAGQPVRHEK